MTPPGNYTRFVAALTQRYPEARLVVKVGEGDEVVVVLGGDGYEEGAVRRGVAGIAQTHGYTLAEVFLYAAGEGLPRESPEPVHSWSEIIKAARHDRTILRTVMCPVIVGYGIGFDAAAKMASRAQHAGARVLLLDLDLDEPRDPQPCGLGMLAWLSAASSDVWRGAADLALLPEPEPGAPPDQSPPCVHATAGSAVDYAERLDTFRRLEGRARQRAWTSILRRFTEARKLDLLVVHAPPGLGLWNSMALSAATVAVVPVSAHPSAAERYDLLRRVGLPVVPVDEFEWVPLP